LVNRISLAIDSISAWLSLPALITLRGHLFFGFESLLPVHRYGEAIIKHGLIAIIAEQKADYDNHYF